MEFEGKKVPVTGGGFIGSHLVNKLAELGLLVFYKELRDILLEKLLHKELKKPWMKHKEIDIILEILRKKKPKRCLEWGAGYSTLIFPKYLDSNALWVAIEHEKDWYNKIKEIANSRNLKLYYIPPNNFPWTDDYNDGSYSDLKDYIEFPKKLGMKFHFILVDGRARKDCLIHALDVLDTNGVVVLHDANRKHYHQPFQFYVNQLLFSDSRKNFGGLWIGSKTLALQNILDIKKHKQIWRWLHIFRGII